MQHSLNPIQIKSIRDSIQALFQSGEPIFNETFLAHISETGTKPWDLPIADDEETPDLISLASNLVTDMDDEPTPEIYHKYMHHYTALNQVHNN